MIAAKQPKYYFKQMEQSAADKEEHITTFLVGDKILDAGCGSGKTIEALLEDGFDAYGIDSSLSAFEEVREKGLEDRFVLGDLLDLSTYYEKNQFDTIIFSSVLHEVFSYSSFDYEKVINTLKSAYNLLPVGGRIIIRDGVIPMGSQKRIIKFRNINDVLFLKEYCRHFKGRYIHYTKIDSLTYEMSEADAMEFLYTFTWGWDSFNREVQEQYGVYSLVDYINQVSNKLPGSKVKFAKSYIQEGYIQHLVSKVLITDLNNKRVSPPDSNMIIVIEKGN